MLGTRPWLLLVMVSLTATLIAGCATNAGFAEFQTYKQTFDDSAAVSTGLIDKLATSEQASLRFGRAPLGKGRLDKVFRPEESAYYVEGVDPPLAAAYRKAVRTINTYNELLLAYATGAAGEQLSAQFQLFSNEVAALGSVTPQSAATLSTLAAVSSSVVKFAARERSRAVFRGQFKRTSPLVVAVINEMQAKTPIVFKNLTARAAMEYEDVVEGIEPGNAEQLRQQFEQSRVLLSGWVVLLDRQKEALLRTQEAVEHPSLGIMLSGATESITKLRITVDQVRAELAK